MDPVISIIMPVYNGEEFLHKTIDDILSSDYTSLELILVDDGSTDGSRNICLERAELDARVLYYKKNNEGAFAARNYGISKATGLYICFCDQDDLVHQQMYSKMIRRMEDTHSDLAICSTGRYVNENVSIYERFDDAIYEGNAIVENVLMPVLINGFDIPEIKKCKGHYPQIWKCIAKTEIFNKNNLQFRRFINYEDDLLMILDLSAHAQCICTLSEMLYCWRVHMGSESYRTKYIEGLQDKQRECRDYILSILKNRNVDKRLINRYRQVQYCRDCLLLLDNENGVGSPRSMMQKLKFLNKAIYTPDYDESKDITKFIRKRQYRLSITMGLICHRQVFLAYYFNKCYNWLVKMGSNTQWFLKLDRFLKRIK